MKSTEDEGFKGYYQRHFKRVEKASRRREWMSLAWPMLAMLVVGFCFGWFLAKQF